MRSEISSPTFRHRHFDEETVHSAVAGEFGMEGRGHEFSLADEHGEVVAAGKYLDRGTGFKDARSANEDHFKWLAGKGRGRDENGGVDLAAVGIALDDGVEDAEAALRRVADVAGEQDGSGAGAEGGFGVGEGCERVKEVAAGRIPTFKEFKDRGGFAAGEDQAVELIEFIGIADFDGVGARLSEGSGVGSEVALDGEDADDGSLFRVQSQSSYEVKRMRGCGGIRANFGHGPLFIIGCGEHSYFTPLLPWLPPAFPWLMANRCLTIAHDAQGRDGGSSSGGKQACDHHGCGRQ
jgi:hypothetical protein